MRRRHSATAPVTTPLQRTTSLSASMQPPWRARRVLITALVAVAVCGFAMALDNPGTALKAAGDATDNITAVGSALHHVMEQLSTEATDEQDVVPADPTLDDQPTDEGSLDPTADPTTVNSTEDPTADTASDTTSDSTEDPAAETESDQASDITDNSITDSEGPTPETTSEPTPEPAPEPTPDPPLSPSASSPTTQSTNVANAPPAPAPVPVLTPPPSTSSPSPSPATYPSPSPSPAPAPTSSPQTSSNSMPLPSNTPAPPSPSPPPPVPLQLPDPLQQLNISSWGFRTQQPNTSIGDYSLSNILNNVFSTRSTPATTGPASSNRVRGYLEYAKGPAKIVPRRIQNSDRLELQNMDSKLRGRLHDLVAVIPTSSCETRFHGTQCSSLMQLILIIRHACCLKQCTKAFPTARIALVCTACASSTSCKWIH